MYHGYLNRPGIERVFTNMASEFVEFYDFLPTAEAV
jgi:hypothetical protein